MTQSIPQSVPRVTACRTRGRRGRRRRKHRRAHRAKFCQGTVRRLPSGGEETLSRRQGSTRTAWATLHAQGQVCPSTGRTESMAQAFRAPTVPLPHYAPPTAFRRCGPRFPAMLRRTWELRPKRHAVLPIGQGPDARTGDPARCGRTSPTGHPAPGAHPSRARAPVAKARWASRGRCP